MARASAAARAADVPFLATRARDGRPRSSAARAVGPRLPRRRRANARAGAARGRAPPSWCHHSVFDVAEVDGAAGAALVAFESDELGDTSSASRSSTCSQRLGWTAASGWPRSGRCSLPYLRCFPDMPPGTWIVENVGTRAGSAAARPRRRAARARARSGPRARLREARRSPASSATTPRSAPTRRSASRSSRSCATRSSRRCSAHPASRA